MIIIKTSLENNLSLEKFFPDENLMFFDIETTGFSRLNCQIYLIGMMYYENNTWVIEQILAESLDDETRILKEFFNRSNDKTTLISFNGDAFDLPFIKDRMDYHNLTYSINFKSFDILKLIRKDRDLLGLPNLKLKTLERYLGIYREDSFNGKDCISFFYSFINQGNLQMKDRLLLHNFEDIKYMLPLISVLDIIESKKTVALDKNKWILNNISVKNKCLKISGTINPVLSSALEIFKTEYTLNATKNKFKLEFNLKPGLVGGRQALYFDVNVLDIEQSTSPALNFNTPKNIFILKLETALVYENLFPLVSLILNDSSYSLT